MPLPTIDLPDAPIEVLEDAMEQIISYDGAMNKLRLAHVRAHVHQLIDVALGYVRAKQDPQHFLTQLDDIFLNEERKTPAELQAEKAKRAILVRPVRHFS